MSSGTVHGRTPTGSTLPPPPKEVPVLRADPKIVAALDAAIVQHDRVAARSTAVWLGAEPTFTDRYSESREWLCEALGTDKELRARQLLRRLLEHLPGAAVLRPVGRQYAGEARPRWAHGLYSRRNGQALWSGPPDAFEDGEPCAATLELLPRFRAALIAAFSSAGWSAAAVTVSEDPDYRRDPKLQPIHSLRLVCRRDQERLVADGRVDVRLLRESVHSRSQEVAPTDALATEGNFLFVLNAGAGAPAANDVWVELPALPDVKSYAKVLELLGQAARSTGIYTLGLRGFPPPIDDTVAWTTLTADPAVLEVNQAPQPTLASFQRATRLLFELAGTVGLCPYRLHYNGAFSDSGGGGQLTFGGPSPNESPFFRVPQLLPRLIRYLVRHPALSYWFATQYVGGSSQSPRPDEGVRDMFLELELGLEQLAKAEHPNAELIWGTLRHFLADSSGNPHRSELNIEKLFNRFLPGRGCLGLVEFRAMAMPASCEHATARALLFHSLIVMLSREDKVTQLKHWGDELHDRFALPFFLRQDLREVFSDLEDAGLGLGGVIEEFLLTKESVSLGSVECGGYRLSVEQALEFWPLVGDVASQESGGSRLVDASTTRIQLSVQALPGVEPRWDKVRVGVKGHAIPLRAELENNGPVHVMGLRFRSFIPWSGLHPTIAAEKTVTIEFTPPDGAGARITLHPWRPNGDAYPGLPEDLADAAARRAERFVVEPLAQPSALAPVPARVTTPFCVDLRRVPGA